MACGAEVQPRAASCAVCGRPIDNATQSLRQSSALPLTPVRSLPTNAPLAPSPSIARSDLDTFRLPSDAAGRALVIVALAMLVDLMVPWLDQVGVRWSPTQAGLPIVLVVAVLAVALAPLTRPSLRRNPLAAVAPLLVGAAFFGGTVVLWVLIHAGGAATSVIINSEEIINTRGSSPPTYTVQLASIDLGLYLFMLGSCVLIYIGYSMVLMAARAGLPPVRQPSSAAAARASAATPARPTSSATPVSQSALTLTGQAREGTRSQVPPPPSLPYEPASRANDATSGSQGAANTSQEQHIALPGTAEWNTAPTPPSRFGASPAAGWRRQPGVRR